ncbi:MAG: hypothetical protein K6E85_17570 [Lachnospiraceae bacterium]|nr:hypothetical protein [Lachnospiraceae bacterium]
MILFILIIIVEMLICAFRSTKKNTVRLICNVASALLAGAITFIISAAVKNSFTDMVNIDLTFGGTLTKADAEKLDLILAAFVAGAALSVLYAVIYWLFKIISLIITKIILNKENNSTGNAESVSENNNTASSTGENRGFNPLGLAFGLVIGIICAGFTVMPYTGLQQLFADKGSGEAVTKLVTQYVGDTPGKVAEISSSPKALTLSKFTGIGFITNGIFNKLTTAKTDAGKESLVEFAVPYIQNVDKFATFADEDPELSELMNTASDALQVFSKTKLFTEKEKISMIENAVQNSVPGVPLPEYKGLNDISEDITYGANIVEIFEKMIPHTGMNDLIDSINIDNINLEHDDIVKLADNLYSMNEGGFYVNLLLEMVFGDNKAHIDTNGDAFRSTKQSFIDILESAMKLKNAIDIDNIHDVEDIHIDELKETVKSIKDSDLVTDEDFHEIIVNIKENIKESNIDLEDIKKLPELQGVDLSGYDSIDDIPDSVIESLFE